jgi:hypothetical protein
VVEKGKTRASGETTAEEVTKEESEQLEEPIKAELPEERQRKFNTPGFARLRTAWSKEDWLIVERAQNAVNGRILDNFQDAYQIMYEVYDLVRTPLVDESTGEIQTDQWGLTLWKQNPSGSYEENWTKLTNKEKENILFAITTRLFEWEQRAADAWGEAMFAKAKWEERFSTEFDAPVAGTVEDRRARGNMQAADDKYFAIFVTLYSRKAEAIVRSLSLIGQRIKDSMS